ncbi:MAG: protein translocase subunit SecD [Verrucomicrobia bacterium]|nr:protein translocase subunit SecD [Verrucomicrobiota bacterium]
MSPAATFLVGLSLLGLFIWYFAAENEHRKRILGSFLTVIVTALCFFATTPPFDVRDKDGKLIEAGKIKLGLDLKGGTSFQVRLVRDNKEAPVTPDMQQQAVEVIRGRVDKFGVGEPVISPVGADQILVQIPGLEAKDLDAARENLQRVAKLEFRLVHPQNEMMLAQIESGQGIVPPGYEVLNSKERDEGPEVKADPAKKEKQDKPKPKIIVKKRPDMTGDRVSQAFPFFDVQGWGVTLKFDSAGSKQFGDLTAANVGQRLAIVLDREVTSAPVLRDAIYGGSAQITGRFTEKEARDLASVLENPLQTPVKIEEQRNVSASLGIESIRSGIYAGIAGLVLVVLFMALYYRLVGLIAFFALLINTLMLFAAMAVMHSVLTLPGIAGVILSLGMAIDANVLINERLREELAAGKSLKAAVQGSYSKAFSAIFDAHVTSLLTSVILFVLATGPVRGFAVALAIGIIASLFSSLLVTRNIFAWVLESGWLKKVSMLNLIPPQNFDFIGRSRLLIRMSVALVLISVAIIGIRGQNNLGTDFRGGDLLSFSYEKPLTTEQVRNALAPLGLRDATIQSEKTLNKEVMTVRSEFGSGEKIREQVQKSFPDAGLKFEQLDRVGALVGKELALRSLISLALGVLGIYIYVAARFENAFAVGSIVALVHDLIVTAGVFALSGREFSLIIVGAFLTIAGYSINDKIVVFDRIRGQLLENKGSLSGMMNLAINETLSRTLLTGGTVLLTVLALYFFGGPVLNDFAFTFLVGVIVGTYSSIFVASPIAYWFSGGSAEAIQAEARRTKAESVPVS